MTEPTGRAGARRASSSRRLSRRDRRRMRREQERGGRRALSAGEVRSQKRAVRRSATSRKDDASVARTAGHRARRRGERRTRGLAGTLGLTFLGAVVPGSGYLYAGRKMIGTVVLLGWLAVAGLVGWRVSTYWGNWTGAIDFVVNTTALKIAIGAMAGLLLVWLFVVWTSYRLVRPRERPRWHTAVGNVAVVVVCVVMAVPVLRVAQYGLATANLVDDVFDNNQTATAPDIDEDAENPWEGTERVSVLLLGGDGGDGRDGVRTDTMILVSIDTETGKAVSFSLPRNMANAQFPEESPLHDLYPYGFSSGDPADGEYMLNAVYRNVPAAHPGVLGRSANEGADAIKQAVEGSLGIPVDYYVLVNLDGFKEIVDAMGGVTVNINEPIAVQGDQYTPPDEWLAPGPNQHLDGYHALWFSRGRVGSDDYERMDRQRCMIDAIVDAADPSNLFARYLDLVAAGEEIVYTDIPRGLLRDFVDLGLKVKEGGMKSVVFKSGDQWSSYDPDFDYMHTVVEQAIDPSKREKTEGKKKKKKKNPAKGAVNACAYNPTGETVEDAIATYGVNE